MFAYQEEKKSSGESTVRLEEQKELNISAKPSIDADVANDNKLKEYSMRIFAGSESMIRDFKLQTPKQLEGDVSNTPSHRGSHQHKHIRNNSDYSKKSDNNYEMSSNSSSMFDKNSF